tara:strand:+ start:547 stop:1404 length:858 start_codon:yes stop_codon:yes gene_type:complete
VEVKEGFTKNKLDDLVLSEDEKQQNLVLACNAIPTSNISLNIEDLGDIVLHEKKIIPAKIQLLEYLNQDTIKLILRFPPSLNFKFNSGQYVNLIRSGMKRSYSLATLYKENFFLVFFIKNYEGGLMSDFWFNKAKVNDLIRIEGPFGSFFLRETIKENIILLATGTGIAPIKSIIEDIENSNKVFCNKKFYLFVGARFEKDLLWSPGLLNKIDLEYIPVLSRPEANWSGEKGYVQNAVFNKNIDLSNAQVYACGSNEMIKSAKDLLITKSLPENEFFSDAFICTK